MALPDFFTRELGTAVVWGEAGATDNYTVTKTLSLNNLADTKARMGASADLGANFYARYLIMLIVETGTAPTAGRVVDLYMACSADGTVWPGGVSGTDAAYQDTQEVEWLAQLGGVVHQLIATNDTNTVQIQQPRLWTPKGRYVVPVVHNQLAQSFRNEGTASNNASRVVLWPYRTVVQDAA